MKYTIEKINEELEGTGWTCQSDTYKNLDTILTFQCANGHLVQDTWKHIRLKQKCPICEQNIYNKNDMLSEYEFDSGFRRSLDLVYFSKNIIDK